MNSSCLGPYNDDWVEPYANAFESAPTVGVVGATYCGYNIRKKEGAFNTVPSIAGIKGKMIAEDLGIISKDKFSGQPRNIPKDERMLYEQVVEKLEQEGYGKLDRPIRPVREPDVPFGKKKCECGSIVRASGLTKHKKTDKHKQLIAKLNK